jgi:hypothetical protein
LYKSRTLKVVKKTLKRQRNWKIIWVAILTVLLILGLVFVTMSGNEPLEFTGAIILLLDLLALAIYLLTIVPNRFSSGFSKTEKLKWFLDKIHQHLESYIETGGREFSRYHSRRFLYVASELFAEWSWKGPEYRAIVRNDLFQGPYLDFSLRLRELFWRLNYFLVRRKKFPIEKQLLSGLHDVNHYLDLNHSAPPGGLLNIMEWSIGQLKTAGDDAIDERMYFGFRYESIERRLQRLQSSPYTVYLVILIANAVATALYFPLAPHMFPDLSPDQIAYVWMGLVSVISLTIATLSTRQRS